MSSPNAPTYANGDNPSVIELLPSHWRNILEKEEQELEAFSEVGKHIVMACMSCDTFLRSVDECLEWRNYPHLNPLAIRLATAHSCMVWLRG